ncbi:MAG: sigma-70 family RNA polymerase sigma factor, partial [Sulfurifustis sp.]
RRLLGLAYRMLGSMAEAEDAVQEAYLRWHDSDRDRVEEPRAFLMTTTTRICLDVLKSARMKREEYVGPWLPDPVTDTASLAPDAQTELAEDLSVALLLALDRLSPLERAAFLLHDVFDVSFADIARTLDESEANCRQLAARARERVRTNRKRFTVSPDMGRRLAGAFIDAARSGDPSRLSALLVEDAKFISDGGGRVSAASKPVLGRKAVAKLLVGIMRRIPAHIEFCAAQVNGLPGFVLRHNGVPIQTLAFEASADAKIAAIYIVRNPDKLRHLLP